MTNPWCPAAYSGGITRCFSFPCDSQFLFPKGCNVILHTQTPRSLDVEIPPVRVRSVRHFTDLTFWRTTPPQPTPHSEAISHDWVSHVFHVSHPIRCMNNPCSCRTRTASSRHLTSSPERTVETGLDPSNNRKRVGNCVFRPFRGSRVQRPASVRKQTLEQSLIKGSRAGNTF